MHKRDIICLQTKESETTVMTVRYYSYMSGTIKTAVLDKETVDELKKCYAKNMHNYFKSFTDYVRAFCEFSM